MINIAIDGPSGAGKSSIAKLLAKKMGIAYLDTGAMYRAIGLKALRSGISCTNEEKVCAMLSDTIIDVEYTGGILYIYLDGEDVSEAIRENRVSKASSDVSAIGRVREVLVQMQQNIAKGKSVVMDGRDTCTNVLPNADFKFFITASPQERARRRFLELCAKGTPKTYDQVFEEMVERDRNDSMRENSPLRIAEGAIVIDTTEMQIESVIERIENIIKGGNK